MIKIFCNLFNKRHTELYCNNNKLIYSIITIAFNNALNTSVKVILNMMFKHVLTLDFYTYGETISGVYLQPNSTLK